MKKNVLVLNALVVLMFLLGACSSSEKHQTKQANDGNGYAYEYVTNDPMGVRIYTLDNGLKVYLSVNKDAPRIQTYIAVRAGATYDPKETTGLAHYLEHMMFKGSSKIGANDWDKEKVLLQQISDLYEEHKATDNNEEKKAIYVKIDSISQIAATYAIANEYDKMMSSVGAKGTNAHTSYEETVYKNDIPSNEFEKWLMLERERFGELVLRLFHTELETVYEEFNISQDSDGRKVINAMMASCFKKHALGAQTVIGEAEHLKSPSMVNIHNYFDNYYVPNNMAMCLSGDLDYEKTIKLIDKHWGDLTPNEDLKALSFEKEEKIAEPIINNVYGPDAEWVYLGYRFDEGKSSKTEKYVAMIDMILCNGKAGLIDLNLNQSQKVLNSYCSPWFMSEYGLHLFTGKPRQGQTLEEVKGLLLAEIEKVKKGEFEDWLLEAVINDLRLHETRGMEHNSRAGKFYQAFINNISWVSLLNEIDELEKITKQELVDFANNNYHDNYVVVYKNIGKDANVVKVDKPQITSIPINREDQSEFLQEFMAKESGRLEPVFVDFKEAISTSKLGSGVELNYLKNETNELFELNYIIDMGKNHDIILPLAVNYLPYIGTDKYSAEELQKEFYKYGLSFGVSAGAERSYIYVSGIKKSFEKGVELLEHVIANAKADDEALKSYVDGIMKKRMNAKLNKSNILWGGMLNYAKHGLESPFRNIIPAEQLAEIEGEKLTALVKEIINYKHRIFYYGESDVNEITAVLDKYHKGGEMKDCSEPVTFVEQPTDGGMVYFVHYEMVQANIVMLAKDQKLDVGIIPDIKLFGQFFGGGLSSIVFQEIRESKALAYSAFSGIMVPSKKEKSHYVYAYVGTSPDKIEIATTAMTNLLNDMPRAQKQFDAARESISKKIETERIIKSNVFWRYQSYLDIGVDYDLRKDVYNKTKTTNLDEFEKFFNDHVSGKKYTYLVMGNKNDVDMKLLSKLGTVKELTLEELFSY